MINHETAEEIAARIQKRVDATHAARAGLSGWPVLLALWLAIKREFGYGKKVKRIGLTLPIAVKFCD